MLNAYFSYYYAFFTTHKTAVKPPAEYFKFPLWISLQITLYSCLQIPLWRIFTWHKNMNTK